jgi:hypothetical protein
MELGRLQAVQAAHSQVVVLALQGGLRVGQTGHLVSIQELLAELPR